MEVIATYENVGFHVTYYNFDRRPSPQLFFDFCRQFTDLSAAEDRPFARVIVIVIEPAFDPFVCSTKKPTTERSMGVVTETLIPNS